MRRNRFWVRWTRAWSGQLGEAAPIGAVGLGAIVIASVYWLFGFLRMGTSGLVAQARGAGEVAETGALC